MSVTFYGYVGSVLGVDAAPIQYQNAYLFRAGSAKDIFLPASVSRSWFDFAINESSLVIEDQVLIPVRHAFDYENPVALSAKQDGVLRLVAKGLGCFYPIVWLRDICAGDSESIEVIDRFQFVAERDVPLMTASIKRLPRLEFEVIY